MLGLVCLYARRLEVMVNFGLGAFLAAFFGLVLAQGFVWATSFTVHRNRSPRLANLQQDYRDPVAKSTDAVSPKSSSEK